MVPEIQTTIQSHRPHVSFPFVDKCQKLWYYYYTLKEKEDTKVFVLRWAFSIIRAFCFKQANCDNCPMKDKCGKIPSEW